MTEQEKFEAIISAPPYHHVCDKHDGDSYRQGEYKYYEVLLAWHIWEDCAKQKQAEIDALRKELEQVKMREAEIIAQAKEEQRESDSALCDKIGDNQYSFKGTNDWSAYLEGAGDAAYNCAAEIRNNKE